ncbi:MAG: hypothetical protein EBU31_07705 [Proteobacteria bacterium]|nr:hypothetical protein [Pseudomonadota bacterium]
MMVPLVREAQAAKDVQRDADALARLSRRHATALSRIRALDDRFTADIADAFRERQAFAQRVADRRSIARSARIVEGVANGSDRTPTLLDLEPLLRELRLGPQERAAVEPALATYRADLARAAQQLASAIIDKPADQLAAWTAAGVGNERMEELKRHAGEGEEARQAMERATADRRAADLQAGRPVARGYAAVDGANRRGLEALCAALPPEAADRLRNADDRRRMSMDQALEGVRFGIDALAMHPDVRSGKAARTVRAIDSVRTALAALTRERIEQARARIASAELGEEAQEQDAKAAREKKCSERLWQLAGELETVTNEEIRDGTLELLKSATTLRPDDMRERLAPVIGAANAERLVSRTARNVFRSERENTDPAWNSDFSIAEQLLLAPGMDHAAFHRAARAIGARDDDPLVEQIWDRHQSRAQALETRQREQMRALESIIVESTRRQREDPAAFERKLGEYLQSLLNADNERRNADDETFREIAIAIDAPDTDARFTLARAVAAARRAGLPWRRFRQPWLLGTMWQSDFDPVSEALEIEDEVSRTAALVVLAAHADRLRETAEDARRTALEGMRDFLLFGLKMQAQGRSGSPEEFRNDTEVRGIVTRIGAGIDRSGARRAFRCDARVRHVPGVLPGRSRMAHGLAAGGRRQDGGDIGRRRGHDGLGIRTLEDGGQGHGAAPGRMAGCAAHDSCARERCGTGGACGIGPGARIALHAARRECVATAAHRGVRCGTVAGRTTAAGRTRGHAAAAGDMVAVSGR